MEVHLYKANVSILGKVAVLYRNQHRKSRKVKKWGCFKQNNKSLGTYLNEVDVSVLPNREFKIMIIKIVTEVRKTMHEQNDNFNNYTRLYVKFVDYEKPDSFSRIHTFKESICNSQTFLVKKT